MIAPMKGLQMTANAALLLSGMALISLLFTLPFLFSSMSEMEAELEASRVEYEELQNRMWMDLRGQKEEMKRTKRQNYEEKAVVASGVDAKKEPKQCPAGSKGEPGPDGIPGPDGLHGQPGQNGEDGQSLAQAQYDDLCSECPPGPPGLNGYKGKRGARGEKGTKGEQGEPGGDGEVGDPGPVGEPGLPGSVGQAGEKGSPGEDGVGGSKGEPGPRGAPGPEGMVGDEGLPGDRGEDGSQGPQGEQGPIGPPGLKGPEGYPGSTGLVGGTGKDAEYCPCPERNKKAPVVAATSAPDGYGEVKSESSAIPVAQAVAPVDDEEGGPEAPGFGPKDYSKTEEEEPSTTQEPFPTPGKAGRTRVSKREHARRLRRKNLLLSA